MKNRNCIANVLVVLVALVLPSAAFGSAAPLPTCTPVTASASLSPGGPPAYPPLAPRPRVRPVRTVVSVAGARRDVVIYPAAPAQLVVADALSGAVLWSAGAKLPPLLTAPLEHAPALLTGESGVAYRAYFGDGAGGVWRLDLPAGTTADWHLSRVAALHTLGAPAGTVAFPVAPDLFRAVDGGGRAYDGIVLAALVESTGVRRLDLVLLRDYRLDGVPGTAPHALADLTAVRDCAASDRSCPPASGPGWYLADAAPGDALAVAPLIDGGRVFLATHDRLSLDCDTATALRFATVIDLESGAGLLGDEASVALGRQTLAAPVPEAGEVRLPGLAEALAARGLDRELLTARGLQVRRRYWLDLLLDAD